MRNLRKKAIICISIVALPTLGGCSRRLWSKEPQPIEPIVAGHAHNDYEHHRPLFDAMENGFCSVEVDIHLVDGELLVAHDRHQTTKGKTLQNLYLDPLRQRVRTNSGSVYPDGGEFTLMIDIKTDAGVDLINVDNLEAFREYYSERRSGKRGIQCIYGLKSENKN